MNEEIQAELEQQRLALKECPKCQARMIKRFSGQVLLTYPPIYPWYWWCGCGHTEKGGKERAKTIDDTYRAVWEEANK